MKKSGKIIIWLVTVSFAISMLLVVTQATKKVQRQTEDSCYSNLQEATSRLAEEFHESAQTDQMILKAMSSVIASEENPSESRLCAIMSSYDILTYYINYVEILRPDNTMLDSDGSVRDVSDSLNFQEEAQRGSYISEMTYSTKRTDDRVIRNAVPVIVDGETIYMLYGVIRLSSLGEIYTTNIYDGHAYVYVLDGSNGDLLLDTWHNTYGNISDFNDRECLSEDDFEDALGKMQQNMSGNLSFRSKSTGDIQYMHYEPIGVNHWYVAVTIQDRYAFATSLRIQGTMRQMAIVIAALVVLYLIFVLLVMMKAYHRIRDVGLKDWVTGLQNRNAYDAFLGKHQNTKIAFVCCAYMDANGLHELNNREGHAAGDRMLSCVAAALREEFSWDTIYRVGGDEFVVITTTFDESVCREKAKSVHALLDEKGYSVAYGIASAENVTGYTEVIHLADERMLENKKSYYGNHERRMRS